jgi:hypothetical protein
MKGSFEDFCELFLKGRGKTPFWNSLQVDYETLAEAKAALKIISTKNWGNYKNSWCGGAY